ncbi:MAG: serine/threonine-protein phosphatase [Phycisphaerales bacterium]|nr:serine/threonine-protein phosphatase [Phycisphaerales bacterium]
MPGTVDEAEEHATTGPAHTMQCMEVWGSLGIVEDSATMPGLDIWVLSRPHDGAVEGGDLHVCSSCGTGRISRVILADVSGHGAKVAELGGVLRGLVRRFVNSIDHGVLLTRLNNEFHARATLGKFATAVLCTYFEPSGVMTISSAGHPRPLVYSTRTRRWRFYGDGKNDLPSPAHGASKGKGSEPANTPLGVLEDAEYAVAPLRMSPGDVVIFYTDSLVEARTGTTAQGGAMLLGEAGLLELLDSITREERMASRTGEVNAATLTRRLVEAVENACASAVDHSGKNSKHGIDDDTTVLVVRINRTIAKQSFLEALAVQLRFVGMCVRALLPGGGPIPWPELSKANILGKFRPVWQRSLGERVAWNE